MTDKTKKNTKPTTEDVGKTAAIAGQEVAQKETICDTESTFRPREHMMVQRLDSSVPLDARLIASVLYDGSFNMLGQLNGQLVECVQAGLIKDANLVDLSKATDAKQETAMEEHNIYCMLAQAANFMTVMGAAVEVILENTEKLKEQHTPKQLEAKEINSENFGTLQPCEGCTVPNVYFNNCQVGTVVNGPYHDNVGGNIQNFSGPDDEEEDAWGDEEEDCDDCACAGTGCMEQRCPAEYGEIDCPKMTERRLYNQTDCHCGSCKGDCAGDASEPEYASELERLIVTLRKEGSESKLILATVTDILKIYDSTYGEDVEE